MLTHLLLDLEIAITMQLPIWQRVSQKIKYIWWVRNRNCPISRASILPTSPNSTNKSIPIFPQPLIKLTSSNSGVVWPQTLVPHSQSNTHLNQFTSAKLWANKSMRSESGRKCATRKTDIPIFEYSPFDIFISECSYYFLTQMPFMQIAMSLSRRGFSSVESIKDLYESLTTYLLGW